MAPREACQYRCNFYEVDRVEEGDQVHGPIDNDVWDEDIDPLKERIITAIQVMELGYSGTWARQKMDTNAFPDGRVPETLKPLFCEKFLIAVDNDKIQITFDEVVLKHSLFEEFRGSIGGKRISLKLKYEGGQFIIVNFDKDYPWNVALALSRDGKQMTVSYNYDGKKSDVTFEKSSDN